MTISTTLSHIAAKIASLVSLIRAGHISIIKSEIRKRFYSKSYSIGLRRDLNTHFEEPQAHIPITIRKLRASDAKIFQTSSAFARKFPRLAAQQLNMVQANIPDCYVAASADDTPTYMQWLIGPRQYPRLAQAVGHIFPPLNSDEALLEGAFAYPEFRGMRIMPEAMARIAQKAKEIEGVRYVITYVDIENIPSLKGCKRAGFSPFLLRTDSWFLFVRSVKFSPLPASLRAQYNEITQSQAFGKTA